MRQSQDNIKTLQIMWLQDKGCKKNNKAIALRDKVQINIQITKIKYWINSKNKDKDILRGWDRVHRNRKERQKDKANL